MQSCRTLPYTTMHMLQDYEYDYDNEYEYEYDLDEYQSLTVSASRPKVVNVCSQQYVDIL